MAKLKEGTKAPAFTLPDESGKKVSLADYKGNPVVVYFYPKDDTPGCTTEACQFNDNLSAFKRASVPVVGISPDDGPSHLKFQKKYGLKFPLLSDPDHKVMERYGAWGDKTLYGRTTKGVIRSTFLVDETGKLAKTWYNVRANGHAEHVLDALRS